MADSNPPMGRLFLGYWSAERCSMPGYYVAVRHEAECYSAERDNLHIGCAPDAWWALPLVADGTNHTRCTCPYDGPEDQSLPHEPGCPKAEPRDVQIATLTSEIESLTRNLTEVRSEVGRVRQEYARQTDRVDVLLAEVAEARQRAFDVADQYSAAAALWARKEADLTREIERHRQTICDDFHVAQRAVEHAMKERDAKWAERDEARQRADALQAERAEDLRHLAHLLGIPQDLSREEIEGTAAELQARATRAEERLAAAARILTARHPGAHRDLCTLCDVLRLLTSDDPVTIDTARSLLTDGPGLSGEKADG